MLFLLLLALFSSSFSQECKSLSKSGCLTESLECCWIDDAMCVNKNSYSFDLTNDFCTSFTQKYKQSCTCSQPNLLDLQRYLQDEEKCQAENKNDCIDESNCCWYSVCFEIPDNNENYCEQLENAGGGDCECFAFVSYLQGVFLVTLLLVFGL